MNEREMLEKIVESAQNLPVPDALQPEQMKKQLEGGTYRKWSRYRTVVAAACLCLCFGAAGLAYQDNAGQQAFEHREISDNADGAESGNGLPEGQNLADEAESDKADHPADDVLPVSEAPVKKLGNMYALASDYGQVYDVLNKTVRKRMEWKKTADVDQVETVREDSDGAEIAYNVKDLASAAMKEEAVANQEGKDFSVTNLQVEGVDESDFVKTDGSFIYVVQDTQIQILDVRDRIPAAAGTIRPQLDEDTDRICEMYVADGMLTVIVQTEQTALRVTPEKKAIALQERSKQEGDKDIQRDEQDVEGTMDHEIKDEVQYVNTSAVTKVLSYDLTDPFKPALQSTTQQDGWYQTSRKIGNRLYLFTNQMLGEGIADGLPRKEAVKEDGLRTWLPAINGKVVSEDCIYLPKEGNGGLLMASVDLADHHKVLDQKLLVNNYAELYVTSQSVYLYERAYANGASRTRIARFSLEADGRIQAKAAKTIKGSIRDTFAIHERNGYLIALTSLTDQEPWENRVYVLDENMETAGKLTGLAKGEQIYAARFAGEMGYFVTYRNTDPLFSVDFSDPHNPKVVGELKVTGFSEYLHFWSDHRLLGIGLETDPQSGAIIGVKLSMFDISDPGNVKEEAKMVLKGVTDCDGMYDYKAVLVNAKKNLIAFITESYEQGYRKEYRVVSYKKGKFVSRVERTLAVGQNGYDSRRWRSVYVEDRLYLVGEKKALVFDMSDEWKEIGKLKYGWEGNS